MERPEKLMELLERYRKEGAGKDTEMPPISTGFDKLDAEIGGWRPSSFNIIGGRTSSGKSCLSLSMAYQTAKKGHSVGLISTQKSTRELLDHLVQVTSTAPGEIEEPPPLEQANIELLRNALDLPLFLYGKPHASIQEVMQQCVRYLDDGVELLVIDQLEGIDMGGLELIELEYDWRSRNTWDWDRLGFKRRIFGSLLTLLKGVSVPVVLTSELSYITDQRGGDKRPHALDISLATGMESFFTTQLTLYRPIIYGLEEWEDQTPTENTAELTIQRDPKRGGVALDLYFDDRNGWFYEYPFHKKLVDRSPSYARTRSSKGPSDEDPDDPPPF